MTRPRDVNKKKKENLPNSGLCRPGRLQSKVKGSEKWDKYLEFARELKQTEHEGNGDTNCNWHTWNNLQRIGNGSGSLGNKRTSGDHPNYSIIKIGQNSQKRPGDLRRLAVKQTPVENCQLTLVGKSLKG